MKKHSALGNGNTIFNDPKFDRTKRKKYKGLTPKDPGTTWAKAPEITKSPEQLLSEKLDRLLAERKK